MIPLTLFSLSEGYQGAIFGPAFMWSIVFVPAFWVYTVWRGLVKHGSRAAWLLVLAPVVFAWPFGFLYLLLICTYSNNCS